MGGGHTFTVTDNTDWGDGELEGAKDIILDIDFVSRLNGNPTGDGIMSIYTNDKKMDKRTIQQGNTKIAINNYLYPGDNDLKISITDKTFSVKTISKDVRMQGGSVQFMNESGELLFEDRVVFGGTAAYQGDEEALKLDNISDKVDYNIVGWATEPWLKDADDSILKNIRSDKVVYPVYNFTLKDNVEPSSITWSDGADEEIVAMMNAAYSGDVDIKSIWNVTDERKVELTDGQKQTLVIMNEGYDAYPRYIKGEINTTEISKYIVGFKNCLKDPTYINANQWNFRIVWSNTYLGQNIHNLVYPLIPNRLKQILLSCYVSGQHMSYDENVGSYNVPMKVVLPQGREVGTAFSAGGDGRTGCAPGDWDKFVTFEYYKTNEDRQKRITDMGESYTTWWTRTHGRSGGNDIRCKYRVINASGVWDAWSTNMNGYQQEYRYLSPIMFI